MTPEHKLLTIQKSNDNMVEIRCKRCNKVLFKANEEPNGGISIKCPKCKYINKF